MPKYIRQVPWMNSDEWALVYQWSYSHDQSRLAIDRVKAWASRGKVPHAIDSTIAFLEVQMASCTELQARLLYSAAFIRFVNGFIDPQQKGAYAASMNGIAENLGMPAWFIEIRHAATHDQLYTLPMLQKASHQALKWLDDHYWKLQKNYKTEMYALASDLLSKYKDQRKKDIQNGIETSSNACTKVLSSFMDSFSMETCCEFMIPILIQPGFLVPLTKRKRVSSQDEALSSNLIQLWSLLLQKCEEAWSGFSCQLLVEIASRLVLQPDSDSVWTLFAWAKYLISSFIPWKDHEPCQLAVTDCAQHWNHVLIRQLLDLISEKTELFKPLIQHFLLGHQGTSVVQQKEMEKEAMVAETDIDLGWTKMKSWKSCPVGSLPNGASCKLDLPAEYRDLEFVKSHVIAIPVMNQEVKLFDRPIKKQKLSKIALL